MPGALTTLGYGALALFVLVAALNWFIFLRNYVKREQYVSMIPLIGGLAGCVGCALVSDLRVYAWAPLLLDPATLMHLLALPFILKEVWQTSRFNLVREYEASGAGKTVVTLRFKTGQEVALQNQPCLSCRTPKRCLRMKLEQAARPYVPAPSGGRREGFDGLVGFSSALSGSSGPA
jgi:hypothetical protein